MKREHVYLAVTAAMTVLAAAQLGAATASNRTTVERNVARPVLRPVPDKPCIPGFGTTTTSFPGKGHSYPCLHLTSFQDPKCKKGYYVVGKPEVIKWGGGWRVRYMCQSPPH